MFHPKGPGFFALARQALSSTDVGYDLLAPRFEYTPFRTPDSVLAVAAEAIGPARAVSSAVDLCCGTGAMLRHLRARCRDRLVGIDRSRGMLAEAQSLLNDPTGTSADESPVDVELLQGDVLALPDALEGAFDVATCFGAFGHIEEPDEPRFVAQVARVLKPEGRFVFVTADPPPVLSRAHVMARGFNAAMRVRNALWSPPFVMYYLTFLLPRARSLLERAGFSVDVRRDVFAGPYARYVLVVATRKGPSRLR